MIRSKAAAVAAALGIALLSPGLLFAQTSSGPPATLPDTMIAPADESAPAPAPAAAPHPKPRSAKPRLARKAVASKAPAPKPATSPAREISYAGVVEPANGQMGIKLDTWAYAAPAKTSNRVAKLGAGTIVQVTGSTRYFAQVKLADGATAFVLLSDMDLNRPADKIFRLTRNSPVLSLPNHYGAQLAEVHQGHDVHVVGTSLNYVRIKMKSGLEGYVPMTALE